MSSENRSVLPWLTDEYQDLLSWMFDEDGDFFPRLTDENRDFQPWLTDEYRSLLLQLTGKKRDLLPWMMILRFLEWNQWLSKLAILSTADCPNKGIFFLKWLTKFEIFCNGKQPKFAFLQGVKKKKKKLIFIHGRLMNLRIICSNWWQNCNFFQRPIDDIRNFMSQATAENRSFND